MSDTQTITEVYEQGKKEGYAEGLNDGWNQGQNQAWDNGYEEGIRADPDEMNRYRSDIRDQLESFVVAIRDGQRDHARIVIQNLLKEVNSLAIVGALW